MGMIGQPLRTHEIPEVQPMIIPAPKQAPVRTPVQEPAKKVEV